MKFARHDSEKNNKKKTIKHYIFVRDDMLKISTCKCHENKDLFGTNFYAKAF